MKIFLVISNSYGDIIPESVWDSREKAQKEADFLDGRTDVYEFELNQESESSLIRRQCLKLDGLDIE